MLELIDGFDSYNGGPDFGVYTWQNSGDLTIKGGRFPGSNAIGTFGPAALNSVPWIYLPSGPLASRTIGFAFYLTGTLQQGPLVTLWDGSTSTAQFSLSYAPATAQLFVQLGAGGTGPITGGLCSGVYGPGYWYFAEFSFTIAGSSSSIQVKVGGVSILNLTGVNLQASTNTTANILSLGGIYTGDMRFDDLYVTNPTGSAPTSFLGESRIIYVAPQADSAVGNTGFAPSTGSSEFALVDGYSPSNNAAYISSNSVGAVSTFGFATLPVFSGAIQAVRLKASVKQDDVASHTVAAVFAKSGINHVSGTTSPTNSSYIGTNSIFLTNPATSAAFTQADITSGEFGVKLVS